MAHVAVRQVNDPNQGNVRAGSAEQLLDRVGHGWAEGADRRQDALAFFRDVPRKTILYTLPIVWAIDADYAVQALHQAMGNHQGIASLRTAAVTSGPRTSAVTSYVR